MSALRQPSCRDLANKLDAYVDGELEPQSLVDIESHVVLCATCREHVELLRATRASLKRAVRTVAPDGLRGRIATAMSAERSRGEERERVVASAKLLSWRSMVPLAGAAAVALIWGAMDCPGQKANQVSAGFDDDVLSAFMKFHETHFPLDQTDPKALGEYERHVHVPVRPARFERGGAKFVSSGVVPVKFRENAAIQNAAMMRFVVGQGQEARTVSAYVFNARQIEVHPANMSPHPVGTADVQVLKRDGYSLAFTEHDGVGCAVAGEVDADRCAQLAAMGCGD